ncbi:MAG: hypothetical protein AB7F59_02995 [Bdellovibrionales bacterium]
MSRFLAFFIGIALVSTANAGLPRSWKEIMENPKYKKTPTLQEMQKKAVAPSGEFKLYKVADRFGFLFDPDGYPVVAFDYTMDPLTWKSMLLGSIGIGGWSLRSLWNKYRKMNETPEDVLKNENVLRHGMYFDPSDETDATYQQFYTDFAKEEAKWLTPSAESDIARGKKEFAKLEFRDEWLAKNVGARLAGGKGRSGFKPTSFTMADLYISSEKENKLYPIMAEFSKLVLKKDLKREGLQDFIAQFKMNWSEDAQEFNLEWAPMNVLGEQAPQLPGWVLNYYNPYDILAYKYGLSNLERNAAILESILGKYGSFISLFVSRIANGLKNRQNAHENALQELLEAYVREEYPINIPWEDPGSFVDTSITMLYLNKMIETDDVTDGVEKRRIVTEKEEKARNQNLEWLQKKKYTAMVWSDNRHATVFKDEKKKGIVSLAIPRNWLTKQPSWLHYENVGWYKHFNRVVLEVFTDAVRIVMPQNLNFGKWLGSAFNIGISIYLPSLFWDMVFRGRSFTELGYEGMTYMKLNEAVRGTWKKVPGYMDDELMKLKSTFASQRVNPFEVPLRYEQKAISANYKLVQDWMNSGVAVSQLATH